MIEKYFAYGSNMNPKRMTSRVGGFMNRNIGILTDHKLSFNKKAYSDGIGYANVIQTPQDFVEGVLYDLTESQINKLDGFEGVQSKEYKRDVIKVYTLDGNQVNAWCYFATNTGLNLLPSKDYLNHLIIGAKGLVSESYLSRLEGQKTKKVIYPKITYPSYAGKTTNYLPAKYRVVEPSNPIEAICESIDEFDERMLSAGQTKKQKNKHRKKVLNRIRRKKIVSPKMADALIGMGTSEMKVFVYGTLKKGHGNNDLMQGAISCEGAMVKGEIYSSGIPFVRMAESDVRCYATQLPVKDFPAHKNAPIKPLDLSKAIVYGELYTFHIWAAIERLDMLEGFHVGMGRNLSQRALVSSEIISSGETKNCWIYLAPHDADLHNRIMSGEWARNYQDSLPF